MTLAEPVPGAAVTSLEGTTTAPDGVGEQEVSPGRRILANLLALSAARPSDVAVHHRPDDPPAPLPG